VLVEGVRLLLRVRLVVGGWWFIGKVSWDMSCEGAVFEMGVAVSGEWWC
jgi:hypothetical protein